MTASNPTVYNPQGFRGFIGDYQGIWWWPFSDLYLHRFNAVWAHQTTNMDGDIWVTGLR